MADEEPMPTERTEEVTLDLPTVAAVPTLAVPPSDRRKVNLFVWHENGNKIPLSPEFVNDASTHRRWRRVKSIEGEWFDHVGEDAQGRWTYRHTDSENHIPSQHLGVAV